ncbi:superinfection immunity protein [Hymenobacter amundsenii]
MLGLFYYFIPTLVGRSKPQSQSIFLINLLLGWTIIGWAYALILALQNSSSHSRL